MKTKIFAEMTDSPAVENIDDFKQEVVATLTGKEKKEMKKKLYAQQHPEPQATQRRILKDIYIDVKNPQEKNELLSIACFEIFSHFDNPFKGFLDLYSRLHDVTIAKSNTLAGLYVQQFVHWLKKNPENEEIYRTSLTEEIQETAMKTLTAHHSLHLAKAADTFRFKDKSAVGIVKNQIENLIDHKKFKEAMDMAKQFDLKDHYAFDKFLLPRILQDAFPDVKEYCKSVVPLQRCIIKFFDDLIYKDDFRISEELRQYCRDQNILNHTAEKITAKSVNKNIKDLLITYGLEKYEKEYAPNQWWFSREKSINYTIKRRFLNNDKHYPALDHISYVSSIKGYLMGTDSTRKEQFIRMLWNSRDTARREDAIAWVCIFNLSTWNIPPEMDYYMKDHPSLVKEIQSSVSSIPPAEDFSDLKLGNTPIVIVDDWAALEKLITLLPAMNIVGIDSEWKPQYLAKVDEVALLQIAVPSSVYLVDFIELEKILKPEQWNAFFTALLSSAGIKLGFDFINDLRAMFHSSVTKEFKEFELSNNNCVCIKLLMENILELDPSFIDLSDPSSSKKNDESIDSFKAVSFKLSTLCEKFLNFTMDKTQQCSDWANRPLTTSQLIYAALDAHILLELYTEIKRVAIEKGLNFEELVSKSLSNASKKERKKAKKEVKKKLDEMSWTEIVEKINEDAIAAHSKSRKAQDFKCAVDLMLLGLGKHLRRCGADVYIPRTAEDLRQAARNDKNRLILTSGKSSEQLRTLFPAQVMILNGANTMDPLQQLKYVIHKAKIHLNKEDIFVRCKECNNVGFLYVPSPVMQALYQSSVVCANVYHDDSFDVIGWKSKLSQLNPNEYEGYGCTVCEEEAWFHVNVHQGRIDILRNLVIHERTDSFIPTQIKHIPENVIRPGRLFYVCAHCGKIYFDGHQQDNYLSKIAGLLPSSSSSSEASHSNAP